MKTRRLLPVLCFFVSRFLPAQVPASASQAFETFAAQVEQRLQRQRANVQQPFAEGAAIAANLSRLRAGELLIVPAATPIVPGGLLHQWSATAFLPGVTAAQLATLLRDFRGYPRIFAPEIESATLDSQHGDDARITLRLRQQHILTVVLDSSYVVRFGAIGAHAGYQSSHSTTIREVSSPPGQDHGFLRRLDTWWTFAEQDGGLLVQVETVSLTRSIPTGLGWVVRPFVTSVPRDSLAFTLAAVRRALSATRPTSIRSSTDNR